MDILLHREHLLPCEQVLAIRESGAGARSASGARGVGVSWQLHGGWWLMSPRMGFRLQI